MSGRPRSIPARRPRWPPSARRSTNRGFGTLPQITQITQIKSSLNLRNLRNLRLESRCMPSCFRIDQLSFGYTAQPVLQGMSAEFESGEFVTLVGPNGAGKSTLLKVLAGLIRGYKGSVEFSGKPLSEFAARDLARRIAFVPQETHMVFPF